MSVMGRVEFGLCPEVVVFNAGLNQVMPCVALHQ